MIGLLIGVILEKQAPQLLLDVNGIGYEIEASMQTFYQLPSIGERVTLYTHLTVREDAHLLFGFFTRAERTLFRSLIKISGVGPKLALAILSSITPEEFIRCIHENDITRLIKIPGVGRKTAERLMIESRDRIDDLNISSNPSFSPSLDMTIAAMSDKLPLQEAISALVALGYKPLDAQKIATKIAEPGMSSEDIIRKSLQGMMR